MHFSCAKLLGHRDEWEKDRIACTNTREIGANGCNQNCPQMFQSKRCTLTDNLDS